MTHSANDSELPADVYGSNEFSPGELDELFEVLAATRRRCALKSLSDAGGTATFDELVGDVARQTATEPADQDHRQDIATSLYHVHLPKLESVGLVSDFDSGGEVELSDRVEEIPYSLFD